MAPPAPPPNAQVLPMRELSPHRTDGAVLPTQPAATTAVVLATAHNWVEHVYKVFGETLPTTPGHVALLGIREAHLALPALKKKQDPADRLEAAEVAAASGQDDVVTEARVGDRDASPTTFNDLLYMVWTDTDAAHTQHVEVFKCTIDPGADESDTTGTPMLLEGKLYKTYPGSHNPAKYPGSTALHIYTDASAHIRVAREATKSTRIMDKVECALVAANTTTGAGKWEFCAYESNDSIHMHFSNNESDPNAAVGRWSTGCTVLRHERTSDRYLLFANRARNAPNAQQLPYLVVSSQYIRTYTAWQAALADKTAQPAEPAGVLMRDKLVAREDVPGMYIPSIATKDFVKAVIKFGEDVVGANGDPKALAPLRGYPGVKGATVTQHAQGATNLLSSLNALCFTISV